MAEEITGGAYLDQARQTRLAVSLFVHVLLLVVAIAILVAVGWWVWEHVIENPLPYGDPDALSAIAMS